MDDESNEGVIAVKRGTQAEGKGIARIDQCGRSETIDVDGTSKLVESTGNIKDHRGYGNDTTTGIRSEGDNRNNSCPTEGHNTGHSRKKNRDNINEANSKIASGNT